MTDQAPMARELTRRDAYPFSRSPDPDEVLASIARWGRPIVVAREFLNSRLHLNPAIARHRERFRELHRVGSQVIYRFEPDATMELQRN